MKTIITTIAATLFATSVTAADIYHGLDTGNSDLSSRLSATEFAGVQPAVGDSVDRYHGWDKGNADLFRGDGRQDRTSTGRPDIYMNVSGSPDLQF